MVVTTTRRKGSTKGQQDKTYYNPSFEKFRSLRAVREHIAATADPVAPDPVHVAAAPEIVLVEDSSSDEDNDDASIADAIFELQRKLKRWYQGWSFQKANIGVMHEFNSDEEYAMILTFYPSTTELSQIAGFD